MLGKRDNLNRISVTEVKNDTSAVFNRVQNAKETIIVEKHKKPSAIIIPYEDFVAMGNILLSDQDRDFFITALARPPAPNRGLKKAMKSFQSKHS